MDLLLYLVGPIVGLFCLAFPYFFSAVAGVGIGSGIIRMPYTFLIFFIFVPLVSVACADVELSNPSPILGPRWPLGFALFMGKLKHGLSWFFLFDAMTVPIMVTLGSASLVFFFRALWSKFRR